MQKYCTFLRCDRCGKEQILDSDSEELGDWNSLSIYGITYDFCPECSRKYDDTLKFFWKEKEK